MPGTGRGCDNLSRVSIPGCCGNWRVLWCVEIERGCVWLQIHPSSSTWYYNVVLSWWLRIWTHCYVWQHLIALACACHLLTCHCCYGLFLDYVAHNLDLKIPAITNLRPVLMPAVQGGERNKHSAFYSKETWYVWNAVMLKPWCQAMSLSWSPNEGYY